MKERPILFSGSMVRALLAGTKTQTRRVVKSSLPIGAWQFSKLEQFNDERLGLQAWFDGGEGSLWGVKCPYGQPGDRLWNREPWKTEARFDHLKPSELPDDARIWYLADGPAPEWCGRFRHARFMPRRFSRGLDEIVHVRVERLQDISEKDSVAEGVSGIPYMMPGDAPPFFMESMAQCRYRKLWESINGPGSWEANPWVWVVEFKVVK